MLYSGFQVIYSHRFSVCSITYHKRLFKSAILNESIKLLKYLLFLFVLSLFHYFRVLFLDAFIFMHIYFNLMCGFFIIMKCSSLALVMSLILNFILSYIIRVISGLLKSLSFPVLLLSIYLCLWCLP